MTELCKLGFIERLFFAEKSHLGQVAKNAGSSKYWGNLGESLHDEVTLFLLFSWLVLYNVS